MAGSTRVVRIHYRSANFIGDADAKIGTFEDVIRQAMDGPMADDYSARACGIRDGDADEAMINRSDLEHPGVMLEIYHLDGRRDLPFLQKLPEKAPTASVLTRKVDDNENAMGSAAYLLIRGDHVAAIEPVTLKPGALTAYFNAFLQKAGVLTPATSWKLVPKVRIQGGETSRNRRLERIEVRPQARLSGEGPSLLPLPKGKRVVPVGKTAAERSASGDKLKEIFEVLGADEADLNALQQAMSDDLGIEAKVIFEVRRNRRKSEAELGTDDMSQAIASLEETNDVAIVSKDGNERKGLSTLYDTAQVLEVGGLLSLPHVNQALTSTLLKWSAQSIIDLSGQ